MSATYNSDNFDPSSQCTTAAAFCWNAGGTKLYVLDSNDDTVYQYSVSPAWDLGGTVTYDSKSVDLSAATPVNILLGDSGDSLYLITDIGDMEQWSLSTTDDVSTATFLYANTTPVDISDLAFSADGTKLGAVGIRRYYLTLTTAWLLSTGTGSNVDNSETMNSFSYNSDGTKSIFSYTDNDDVKEQELATAWDVKTATENGEKFDISSQETAVTTVRFGNSGANLYVIGTANNVVYQYDVSPAYDIAPDWGNDFGVKSAYSKNSTAAASLTFSVPSQLEDDDVIYFWCNKDDDAGGNWACTGFTHVSTLATTAGNDLSSGLLYKIITNAAGESSYSVGTTDVDAMTVTMIVVRGADVSSATALFDNDPITDGYSHAADDNTVTPASAAIDTTNDGCLILAGAAADDGNNPLTFTAPSGTDPATYTLLTNQASSAGASQGFASGGLQTTAGSGATGTVTWGGSDSSAENHVILWAVAPGSSTTTYDGTASFAGSGTVSADGAATLGASASFTGAGALTASGSYVYSASSAFTGAGSFSATGQQITLYSGTSAFNGAGAISSTGVAIRNGAASFDGAGTTAGSGVAIRKGTADFTAAGAFAGIGEYQAGATTYDGTAAFTGSGDVIASGNSIKAGESAFTGAGTLSAAGEQLTLYPGTAAFDGSASFNSVGSILYAGSASFNGAGSFAGSAKTTHAAQATFDAASTFVASGGYVYSASSAFAGAATFTAFGEQLSVYFGTATFTGANSLSGDGDALYSGAAIFTGGATFSGTGRHVVAATASFAGAGSLDANGQLFRITAGAASFAGSGVPTFSPRSIRSASAEFVGSGTQISNANTIRSASAAFVGDGGISASGSYIQPATAAFSGTSSYTAVGVSVRSATASFSCGSSISATGATTTAGVASFSGGGDVVFNPEFLIGSPGYLCNSIIINAALNAGHVVDATLDASNMVSGILGADHALSAALDADHVLSAALDAEIEVPGCPVQ